ncbi:MULTISPECIES: tonB-system energizer ExbB [unclassified Rhizobium]|uniref:tonB-system energizer ExbB n=1 Tax=unclassified Rhizobium TaxID=2613769 RepID=UPI0007139F21|nr:MULTISPECIES: tonB-system energizer ExbB [unclassified Rhizobium]KQS88400.1 biopolymer transport protein ExbB [Rhizobium sp. Leaf391]KQT03991.1 biopolymer transport protein ExbB [Rhizobium sp. Leaf386]KQT95547.1 biopolymer transport protein ExbB [Rhizobium sp. Leaf453]
MPNRAMPKLIMLAAVLLAVSNAGALHAQETQAPAGSEVQQPAAAVTTDGVTQAAPAQTATQTAPADATTQAAPADAATDVTPAAQGEQGDGQAAANPVLPHDLSPMGMFMAADIVVKGVMTALALASVATWAILLVKIFELSAAKRAARRAVRALTDAVVLRDVRASFAAKKGPAAQMIEAASDELSKSEAVLDVVSTQGVKERVASQVSRIEARAGKSIAGGTGVLATIGSISPFVGLFGTVWGIMNSFIGISQAQTTNLAIVAPGIAEALLATAIGLVAAIPAVVIYNYFARSIAGYRLILADASAAVERVVSRDLDFRQARRIAPRKADGHAHSDAGIARIG